MIKILVADDHELMREAIIQLLQSHWSSLVIDSAGSYDEVLEQFNRTQQPYDLILLDLHMPGMRGAESVRALMCAAGQSPIIVFTGIEAPDLLHRLQHTGILKILKKTCHSNELLQEIRLVSTLFNSNNESKHACFNETADRSTDHACFNETADRSTDLPIALNESTASNDYEDALLTQRQLDILRLLHQGKPNKIIARELNVALGTVKNHLYLLFTKLNVSSRAQAITKTREWFL